MDARQYPLLTLVKTSNSQQKFSQGSQHRMNMASIFQLLFGTQVSSCNFGFTFGSPRTRHISSLEPGCRMRRAPRRRAQAQAGEGPVAQLLDRSGVSETKLRGSKAVLPGKWGGQFAFHTYSWSSGVGVRMGRRLGPVGGQICDAGSESISGQAK